MEKCAERQPEYNYYFFNEILDFVKKQMHAPGPLADLIRSGIVLAPVPVENKLPYLRSLWMKIELLIADLIRSGIVLSPVPVVNKLSYLQSLRMKIELLIYLWQNPGCKDHFFFQRSVMDVSALAFDCSNEPDIKRDNLLRAAEQAEEIAEAIHAFPQPVLIIYWKTDGDSELNAAARRIASAVKAKMPGFQLHEFPSQDGMILSSAGSVIRFEAEKRSP
jgi:hypothetical protein